jgi:hypothetical protein
MAMTPHERLKRRIADILDGSLGLDVFPASWSAAWRSREPIIAHNRPYLAGIRVGLFYALLFCATPWLAYLGFRSSFSQPSWPLFFLQIYGSFWSAWATATTRMASSSISRTIENDIIPELSDGTAEAITRDLTHRFERRRLLCVSWCIAFVGAACAGYLVNQDVSRISTIPKPLIGEVIWWSLGWAVLFATAAKVVNVSSFYRVFAARLVDDSEKLYALDPARSPPVINVASVAQRMLLFWLGIAVSIGVVIPFSVKDWSLWLRTGHFSELLGLDLAHNSFVLAYVLLTTVFSIGVGTMVFLRSETAIRQAVTKVTNRTLRSIEFKVADLSDKFGDADRARLTELNALHKEVAMGSYRSLIVSWLSVLVPVIPLISTLVSALLSVYSAKPR